MPRGLESRHNNARSSDLIAGVASSILLLPSRADAADRFPVFIEEVSASSIFSAIRYRIEYIEEQSTSRTSINTLCSFVAFRICYKYVTFEEYKWKSDLFPSSNFTQAFEKNVTFLFVQSATLLLDNREDFQVEWFTSHELRAVAGWRAKTKSKDEVPSREPCLTPTGPLPLQRFLVRIAGAEQRGLAVYYIYRRGHIALLVIPADSCPSSRTVERLQPLGKRAAVRLLPRERWSARPRGESVGSISRSIELLLLLSWQCRSGG